MFEDDPLPGTVCDRMCFDPRSCRMSHSPARLCRTQPYAPDPRKQTKIKIHSIDASLFFITEEHNMSLNLI